MLIDSCLFIFFFILSFLFISFYNQKKKGDISNRSILLCFGLKVIIGCLYGYIFKIIYKGDDTWLYHQLSLDEVILLKTHPLQFFTNFFSPGNSSNTISTILDSRNSSWKDLEYNLLIKILAVFNLFSGSSYYINVIFYNLITFWGHYYLLKTVSKAFPDKHTLFLIVIFFFPPFLFWMSGIRKDGLIFTLFAIFLYNTYYILQSNPRKIRSLVVASTSFILLFIFRKFTALLFIPVLLSWIITTKWKKNAFIIFTTVHLLLFTAFVLTEKLPSKYNLVNKLAMWQQDFFELKGGSYLPLDTLHKVRDLKTILPQAINHTFFRPYPTEMNKPLFFLAGCETLLMYILIIILFFNIRKDWRAILKNPLWLTIIFYSLTSFIAVGITVPFLGAIVRYKSLPELLFIIALITLLNQSFAKKFKFINK